MPDIAQTAAPTPDDSDIRKSSLSPRMSRQLLYSEQQWIMNRLQWLFTSHPSYHRFCGADYPRPGAGQAGVVQWLTVALPIVGILFCTMVGLAISVRKAVMRPLGNARGDLAGCYQPARAQTRCPSATRGH